MICDGNRLGATGVRSHSIGCGCTVTYDGPVRERAAFLQSSRLGDAMDGAVGDAGSRGLSARLFFWLGHIGRWLIAGICDPGTG